MKKYAPFILAVIFFGLAAILYKPTVIYTPPLQAPKSLSINQNVTGPPVAPHIPPAAKEPVKVERVGPKIGSDFDKTPSEVSRKRELEKRESKIFMPVFNQEYINKGVSGQAWRGNDMVWYEYTDGKLEYEIIFKDENTAIVHIPNRPTRAFLKVDKSIYDYLLTEGIDSLKMNPAEGLFHQIPERIRYHRQREQEK